jgi:hypothetical protein
MKTLLRSVNIPLGRVAQITDTNGKSINLARFNNYADDDHLKSLAADIKRNGQLEPCCVQVVSPEPVELPATQEALDIFLAANPDVNFALITGNNRYKACQIAGLKQLIVNVIDGERGELISVSVSENLAKPLSPMDRAVAYYRLTMPTQLGGAGMKETTIAARHNEALNTVRNYLLLLELPREFQQAIHDSDQKLGKWSKENDDWNKLGVTKALGLLREARKYASTLVAEKDDPEGWAGHVRLALGRVYMQFEKGLDEPNGKSPSGFWRVEAIWPEGSRKPETTTPAPSSQPIDSKGLKEEAGEPPEVTAQESGADESKEPSARSAGVSPGNKPHKEKFDLRMVGSYLKTETNKIPKEFQDIPQNNEVLSAIRLTEIYLSHLETCEPGSDKAMQYTGEWVAGIVRLCEGVEKISTKLMSYESAGLSGGTVLNATAKPRTNGKSS